MCSTMEGKAKVVVIETNSCPSGQKSFPLLRETEEDGGYRRLIETTFADLMKEPAAPGSAGAEAAAPKEPSCELSDPVEGVLAVIYDKNVMEASGYASVMSEVAGEPVYMAEFYLTDSKPPVVFDEERVAWVRVKEEDIPADAPHTERRSATAPAGAFLPPQDAEASASGAAEATGAERVEVPAASLDLPGHVWLPVRAAFRYVTQRPWTRIPIHTRTRILNPILPCLAGGRNKLMASKAYDYFNGQMEAKGSHLRITTPTTLHDVQKEAVPFAIKSLGGTGVIKVPYSNAGQGVFTILSKKELDEFMATEFHYDKFIVQALIGNAAWGSVDAREGRLYHVGTLPNRKGDIFVADMRMMVSYTGTGWRPVAAYARRARDPLKDEVGGEVFSWGMLGTNLSKLTGDLTWTTEAERLLLADRKDFSTLGIGVDQLIEAFLQTVMAATAIDRMCKMLSTGGKFNLELFGSLNDDASLLDEIRV